MNGALVRRSGPTRRQGVAGARLVEREIGERRETGDRGLGIGATEGRPAGFVAIVSVTLPVNDGVGLPNASCAATTTAGVIGLPSCTLARLHRETQLGGRRGRTSNAVLVAGVRLPELATSV